MLVDLHAHYPMHLIPPEQADTQAAVTARRPGARWKAIVIDLLSRRLNYEGPKGAPSVTVELMRAGDVGAVLSVLYSPLDEKPKRSADPHDLARVNDLLVLPEASLLVDRWSEDWSRLGWLRVHGRAELLEPEPHEREEHATALDQLREKYPQYVGQDLEHRPLIRVTIDEARSWGDLSPD